MQWIGSLRLTIFKMNNSKWNRNERCTSVNIVAGIMVDVGIVIVLQL